MPFLDELRPSPMPQQVPSTLVRTRLALPVPTRTGVHRGYQHRTCGNVTVPAARTMVTLPSFQASGPRAGTALPPWSLVSKSGPGGGEWWRATDSVGFRRPSGTQFCCTLLIRWMLYRLVSVIPPGSWENDVEALTAPIEVTREGTATL